MDNKVNLKQFWHYCFNRKVQNILWAFLMILIMCATSLVETLKESNIPLLAGIIEAAILALKWATDNRSPNDAVRNIHTEIGPQDVPVFLNSDLSQPYGKQDKPLIRNMQKNELLDLMYRIGAKNDIIILYGPSGCGKSQLLKLFVQGGEFSRNRKRVHFYADHALEIQTELGNIPYILAKSNSRTYKSMLLIDQGERISMDDKNKLDKLLKDNLKDRKIIIAVSDSNFGNVFHAMKQLAEENKCNCAAYYLTASNEDRQEIHSVLVAACKSEIWSDERLAAFAVVSYARFALETNQISLVQYRFIWSLFFHKEQMGPLTEEGKKLLEAIRMSKIAGPSFGNRPENLISQNANDSYRKIEKVVPISDLMDRVTEAYFLALEQIYKKDMQSLPFYEMLQFFADGAPHTMEDIALLTFTDSGVILEWINKMMAHSLIRQVDGSSYVASHQWIADVFRALSQRRLSGDLRDQVEAIIDQFPHYRDALNKANKNYHRGSEKWGDGIATFCSIATLLLSGIWISMNTWTFPEFLFRILITLCLYAAVAFFANFIRYNACICKPAINRLLYFPAILIGLFPMCAFLIPGLEKLDIFWMVFLGMNNSIIGIYFLMVCRKRMETAKNHFIVKGIEFITIGLALCAYGLLTGWWRLRLVDSGAVLSNFDQFLQLSLWIFPCVAYLILIILSIWNYCSPQFLPSLRLKACMIENKDFANQHII